MKEELESKIIEILKQNKVKPELWNIRTIMAMESAYRQGYMDAMEEMSKDSDTQEQYDKHHKPCDKVSHDCHVEYDTMSHDRSCWNCEHFEYEEDDDGSEIMFCHHDDMRTSLQLPLKDCKLYEATNGKLSR